MKPKIQRISEGRIVKPTGFKVRTQKMMDEEEQQKMAKGGMINEEISMSKAEDDMKEMPKSIMKDDSKMSPSKEDIMANHARMLAEGGMVDHEEEIEHAASIAAAIMAKRKKMAEGGMVDLSMNADEEPNLEDQLSFEALKKENYSESDALEDMDQPEDSNEHGDDIMSDKHDRISEIRRRMKKRSPITE